MATTSDDLGQDAIEMRWDPSVPSYSRQPSAMTQSSRRDRLKGLGRSMKNSFADFFGVGNECPEEQEKWRQRSRNLACKRSVGGGLKPELLRSGTMDSVFMDSGALTAPVTVPQSAGPAFRSQHPLSASFQGHPLSSGFQGHPLGSSFQGRPCPKPIDPLHRPTRQLSHTSRSGFPMRQLSRQISTASSSKRSTRMQPSRRSRKDSVVKMAYDGVKTLMEETPRLDEASGQPGGGRRRTPTRKSTRRKPYLRSRSFAPNSISSYQDDMDTLKDESHLLRPQMSWMSYMSNSSYFSGGLSDRSQSPLQDSVFHDDTVLDDVFFDIPAPGSPLVAPFSGEPPQFPIPATAAGPQQPASAFSEEGEAGAVGGPLTAGPGPLTAGPQLPTLWEKRLSEGAVSDAGELNIVVPDQEELDRRQREQQQQQQQQQQGTISDEDEHRRENGKAEETKPLQRPLKRGWSIGRQKPQPLPGTPDIDLGGGRGGDEEDEVDGVFKPMARVPEYLVDQVADNSDRREIGKGLVGRFLKQSYRRDRINSDIKAQIDDIDDHRPYFTYWVTFVQVLIYVISVAVYGIAPIGFEETIIKKEVMMPNLAIEKKHYFEKENFWFGPRQADLIHLGAKYSPCMRKDEHIERALYMDRFKENKTACCIRNDGSGCVQMAEKDCSPTLATWHTWRSSNQRTSGSVCGLDPNACLSPPSTGAFAWKNDITTWPICTKYVNLTGLSVNHEHLTCEVVGRPCCVGIQGECMITTREFCTFRRGYFHEEAFLCSQISCMNEICGMIPFLYDDRPDQVYRFWTSLFLHAGLLQLVVTVLFQFFIMRDLEKLAGWLRIAIIYLGSGIAGSMSSAIFLPYHVEAGPAGSQFGLLACLIVEVIQNWYILQRPFWAVGKLVIIVLVLFAIGLLPMVDNYAHLVGFIFGFLLSFALLPYVTFGRFDRRRKIIGIVICLLSCAGLLALLIVLFYVIGVYDCPYCHYFNCIPFTPKFCQSMEVKIGRPEM